MLVWQDLEKTQLALNDIGKEFASAIVQVGAAWFSGRWPHPCLRMRTILTQGFPRGRDPFAHFTVVLLATFTDASRAHLRGSLFDPVPAVVSLRRSCCIHMVLLYTPRPTQMVPRNSSWRSSSTNASYRSTNSGEHASETSPSSGWKW